jgi:hypothetical protein
MGAFCRRRPTYGGVTQKDEQALVETNAAAKESCSSLAPGVTDFPIERFLLARRRHAPL